MVACTILRQRASCAAFWRSGINQARTYPPEEPRPNRERSSRFLVLLLLEQSTRRPSVRRRAPSGLPDAGCYDGYREFHYYRLFFYCYLFLSVLVCSFFCGRFFCLSLLVLFSFHTGDRTRRRPRPRPPAVPCLRHRGPTMSGKYEGWPVWPVSNWFCWPDPRANRSRGGLPGDIFWRRRLKRKEKPLSSPEFCLN